MIPKPFQKFKPSVREPLKAFSDEWLACKFCPLHKTRGSVVLWRGSLPAEVLFIGEGPGKSEDDMGVPFVGEAGHKLQDMLANIQSLTGAFRYALANIVACMPTSPPDSEEDQETLITRDPTRKEAEACSQRLHEFIMICKPKVIFLLGKVPEKHIAGATPHSDYVKKLVKLQHPAHILRIESGPQHALATKRWELTIRETLKAEGLV